MNSVENVKITQEVVTPEMAEAWLNQNKTNRQLRPGVADKYADDMRKNRWTTSIDPIAFYEDNDVANGQHRLFAVVESGRPQAFIIVRNLKREDGLNLDTGFVRTLIDNARISGKDDGLSATLVTAANAIAYGSANLKGASYAKKLKVIAEYREPAGFASSHVRRVKYLCAGPILGAVGRAYMHVADHEKLQRFCSVLGSGQYDGDKELAAIVLRNWLFTRGSTASASANWADTFLKCQNAISHFMAGRKISVIKASVEEVYPLPQKLKQARKKAA